MNVVWLLADDDPFNMRQPKYWQASRSDILHHAAGGPFLDDEDENERQLIDYDALAAQMDMLLIGHGD